MNLTDIIGIAMQREKNALEFYTGATEITEDPNGKEAFIWLAQQERTHYAGLSKLKEALLQSGGDISFEPLSSEDAGSIAESSASEVFDEITTSTTAIEALQGAAKNERASIELYRRLERSTPDPGAKALFEGLVSEEQTHLLMLEAQINELEQSRAFISLCQLQAEMCD